MPFNSTLLRRLWPHAPQVLVDAVAAAAPTVFQKYGFDADGPEVAQAMAQFSHECAGGTIREESLNYTSAARIAAVWPSRFNQATAAMYVRNPRKLANKVYNGRMGNRPGTDDGYNFRGRGGSQCTGREGYTRLAAKTGLPLLDNPALVNEPQYWLECAVADFVLCGCLPYAKRDDTRGVTKHLNGGYIGLSEREAWLARWKRALAVTHTSAPEDSLTRDDVRALQERLRDLGYHEVGNPDGKWGSRTSGAIAAFQRHEMLPVTGHYDDATREALDGAAERPVAPERAEATADDLREAGSETVAKADTASMAGLAKAGGGALLVGGGAGERVGLFDQAQDAVDKAQQAKSLWERAHDALQPIFHDDRMLIAGLVLLVGGLIVMWAARRVIARRVADHRAGIHAGVA